jgi:hypothetical protein
LASARPSGQGLHLRASWRRPDFRRVRRLTWSGHG